MVHSDPPFGPLETLHFRRRVHMFARQLQPIPTALGIGRESVYRVFEGGIGIPTGGPE